MSGTGAALASYSYGPYGEASAYAINASGAIAYAIGESYFGYNGEDYDPMTGLQYLRARYYDASSGRFGTADTYPGTLLDPLSQNPYSYTQGDPINFSDPSGHGILSAIGNFFVSAAKTVGNAVKTAYTAATQVQVTRYTPPTSSSSWANQNTAASKPPATPSATSWIGPYTPKPSVASYGYSPNVPPSGLPLYNTGAGSRTWQPPMAQPYIAAMTQALSARLNQPFCTTADRIQSTDWNANVTTKSTGLLAMMEAAKNTLQYEQAMALMPGTEKLVTDNNLVAPFLAIMAWKQANDDKALQDQIDCAIQWVEMFGIGPDDPRFTEYVLQQVKMQQDDYDAVIGMYGGVEKGALEDVLKGVSSSPSLENDILKEIENSAESTDKIAGSIKKNIIFGSDTKSATTLANQMSQRGWAENTVQDVVNNPYTTRISKNMATGNPATAYYNKSGGYVVVDDVTGEVVQVSNLNDPVWEPDKNIVDPYKP